MAKFNIYQIKSENVSELLAKFKSVGLVQQNSKTVEDFTLTFYFSDKPDESEIKWLSLYKDFFPSSVAPVAKNVSYYGALIAERRGIFYAISLGKSHFYLQRHCYFDFGINLGIRVLDENGVIIKNARKFGSSKKKALVTYRGASALDIESGETVEYLRGNTDDESWGKKANFGISAQFSIKDMKPSGIPYLLNQIEDALQDEPNFRIPRTSEVKEPTELKALDQKLVDSILSTTASVSFEELAVSGIDFIFLNDFRYVVKGPFQEVPISTGSSLGDLLNAITEAGFVLSGSTVNEIRIKAESDDSRGHTKTLKEILDYTDDGWNYLRDGRWFQFNQEYKDGLITQVDSIEVETFETIPYVEEDFLAWQSSLPEGERPKWYAEKYFNEKVAPSHGYLNLDRSLESDMGYRIEYCDLFKDDCFYFVKIGSPQKLAYVIDQATTSLRLLQKNRGVVKIGGVELKPKAYAIWLILDREHPIAKISSIRSIIFLQKVADWIREVHNANLKPRIIISYKQ